ncbi:hypothetical protein LUZ60_008717 [Juncus effusus]|nr:hypothetical protein LUZ60_008717 [Juncus effusus]
MKPKHSHNYLLCSLTLQDLTMLAPQISLFHSISSRVHLNSLVSSSSSSTISSRRTARCKTLKNGSLLSLPHCRLIAKSSTASVEVKSEAEPIVANGYTMTQFCDKMIEFFIDKKPNTKDWRKLLVFRDEWKKYSDKFYERVQVRIDTETDSSFKQKLVLLARKMKKVDDEIEKHMELFKEVRESPLDIDVVVAKRRKDFTDDFFLHLNVLYDCGCSLEEKDEITRLGGKCLSAVRAYDCTLENRDSIDSAKSKFDELLNSDSLDEIRAKINSLAKAKELDSSLILFINQAWAAAKDSATMKNEVKEIMYQIYKATQKSLKSIVPREIKLLKHLLNFSDPDERFTALAKCFSLDEEEEDQNKDADALTSTPKELHKWTKIMLDAFYLNKEETDIIEARKLGDPVVIQRLIILKETLENDYLTNYVHKDGEEVSENK